MAKDLNPMKVESKKFLPEGYTIDIVTENTVYQGCLDSTYIIVIDRFVGFCWIFNHRHNVKGLAQISQTEVRLRK